MQYERYLLIIGGIVFTSTTMTGNIMFSYKMLDGFDPTARIMFVAISIAIDAIPVALIAVIRRYHKNGKAVHTLVALTAWLFASSFAIYSCAEYFKSTFEPAEVSKERSTEFARNTDEKLRYEAGLLAVADKKAIDGPTIAIRDSAKGEARQIRSRIKELESSRWSGQPVRAGILKHGFYGMEIYASIAVFIMAQICWFFATDAPTKTGQEVNQPNDSLVRNASHQDNQSNQKKDQTHHQPNHSTIQIASLLTNDEVKVRNGSQPSYVKFANQSNQVTENSPTNLTKLWKDDQQSQPKKPVETKTGLQPEPDKPVLQFVTIDDRIAKLVQAGESERNIADKLNVKRSRVQRVKKEMLSRVVVAAE